MFSIFSLLTAHIMLQGDAETEDERAERLRVEKESTMTEEELKVIPVVGSISLFMNRLDEEYIKSLQRTSSHSPDYIVRLRDEAQLVKLLKKIFNYFVRVDSKGEAAQMALRRVEHVYYVHDTIVNLADGESVDTAKLISDLCTYVYQEGTDRSKTRAMLCHIFHHALHVFCFQIERPLHVYIKSDIRVLLFDKISL